MLDVQKSKSAVVDGKPNPDINASNDLMANTLKYVVQEAVTAKTRLCEDCVERLEALGQDE